MRRILKALALGAFGWNGASAALDMLPTALTVVMSDSVHNPDSDSITVTLSIMVKGGPTKRGPRWTAAQIGIEGIVRMNGIVDSGQVMDANVQYTYRIGAWVDKQPFSIVGFTDPEGILGEAQADLANNAIVRTYRFRPIVKKDTVYTGPNCPKPSPVGAASMQSAAAPVKGGF